MPSAPFIEEAGGFWPCKVIWGSATATCQSDSYWLTEFIQPLTWERPNNLGSSINSETYSSLDMQLVRVPRLLECLILRVEVRGCGLQDSLGRSRVPEKSLFTAHLISGSWSGSRKRSCSEESHCLWDRQKQGGKKKSRNVSELSISSLNDLWFAAALLLEVIWNKQTKKSCSKVGRQH